MFLEAFDIHLQHIDFVEVKRREHIIQTVHGNLDLTIIRKGESAAADKAALPGSERQKVGDYFASGMDEARIEKLADRFRRVVEAMTADTREKR